MDKPDFQDAHIKLGRAHEHIAEVDAAIKSFLSADFYRLRFKFDERENSVGFLFDSLHQPDRRLNTLIGDAISNLRSVLDYLAVAAVSPITGSAESIGFPFADDAKGFSGITKKAIGPCGNILVDHFLNEVQAYKGGKGEIFWVLNKLRNIDKHRLLIATVNIAGLYVTARMGPIVMEDCFFGTPEGQEARAFKFPASWKVDFASKPRPAFEVSFSEPPYIDQISVIEFLQRASKDVGVLLNELSALK